MTHSQTYNWRAFCKESLDKIENYQQALAENFKGWCIHHRREIQPDGTRVSRQELKDKGLYYGRSASELIFMRNGEHSALHSIGNKFSLGYHHSEDHRQKNSLAHRGKHHSAETRLKLSEAAKGRTLSEETRKKIAETRIGKHLLAETRHKMSEAICGMLYWNNGISNKRSRECPGEGWKRGRLKYRS